MKVSILMSVHNGERFVREAVLSILNQTFRDFEFLIVDDASTDGTCGILEELATQDRRIRVLTNAANLGLTKSLNKALQLCRQYSLNGDIGFTPSTSSRGKPYAGVEGILADNRYIARMDADDIALPQRLEKQIAFLEAHPDVGVVGTWYQLINDRGDIVGEKHPPIDHVALHRALIRYNPFLHSSTMIRKDLLDRVQGYDEHYRRAQDYDLWMRLSSLTAFANLPEVLMQKRFTTSMVSYAREQEQLRAAVQIRLQAIKDRRYPFWCLLFIIRPLLASLLPTSLVRFVRIHVFRQKHYQFPT